jgi:branched-chain amino acid transport system permease protein
MRTTSVSWFDDRRIPMLAPWLIGAAGVFSFLPNPYAVHVAVLISIYVMLGMGLSIVVGLAGMLDLGYVAFYAVGAYGYALLSTHAGVGFWTALALCWIPAAAIGILLGLPTLRVSGDYLALVTLGLGEIIRMILLNWGAVTNGPQGIMGIAAPTLLGHPVTTPREFFWVGGAIAVVVTMVAYRIRFSRAGLTLLAVRDNEPAAAASGIVPYKWRLFAFATGGAIGATAGVFFAAWQRFVSPSSFNLLESVLVLSIVVLAGYGRILGIVLSATFFVITPEILRQFATARLLVYGLMLIAVVLIQERLRLRRLDRRQHRQRDVESALAVPSRVDPVATAQGPTLRWDINMDEPLLTVSGLYKKFGGVTALDGVELTIREGELLGLVGPNGAGKTTLFNCLAGVVRPDHGSLRLVSGGRVIPVPDAPWLACRAGIGRTFQDGGVFESLTVLENVMVGVPDAIARIMARPFLGGRRRERQHVEAEAREALRLVDVQHLEGSASDMPLSVQKRIAIARAIATRPILLLLDEPAAGMPAEERQRFMEQIKRLQGALRITMVIIEHDPAFVLGLATRLVVLDQGKVIADGEPNAVANDPNVQRVYFQSMVLA